MTEIELLSKTETEEGSTSARKKVFGIVALGDLFLIAVAAFMWNQVNSRIALAAMVACAVAGTVFLYFHIKRQGPPRVPVKEGALTVSESGLVFSTGERSTEVKPEEIELLKFVFNGWYGRMPLSAVGDGESEVNNRLVVKLRSGSGIDSFYAINDVTNRKQLRKDLNALSKAGVKVVVSNTHDDTVRHL